MEENLEINKKVNNDKCENTTKSNSEEIKKPKSEKDTNTDINNGNYQSNSVSKVNIKNENDTPFKPSIKPKKNFQ